MKLCTVSLFPKQNYNVLSSSGSVSQFLHSFICERWSVCLFCCSLINRSWEYINRSQTHECENCSSSRRIFFAVCCKDIIWVLPFVRRISSQETPLEQLKVFYKMGKVLWSPKYIWKILGFFLEVKICLKKVSFNTISALETTVKRKPTQGSKNKKLKLKKRWASKLFLKPAFANPQIF